MKPDRMIDLSQLDDLARRLSGLVLARTREKLEQLERQLAELANAPAGDSQQPPRH